MTLTNHQEASLIKAYYTDGYAIGRDKLFELMKQRQPATHPTKRDIGDWLKRQTVHQLYQIPKLPKQVVAFKHVKPIHTFAIDLIDYSNKPVNDYNYVVNMIDNFSRFMWTVPIKRKTPEHVVDAITPILAHVHQKYGKYPKFIMQDHGSEFFGAYTAYLTTLGIKIHRTIGGMPQSNGLIERSNLTMKQILNRQKKSTAGHPNWFTLLQSATRIYNDTYHSAIKMQPRLAIELTDENVLKDMRDEQHKDRVIHKAEPKNYEVGDVVRLRKLKNALSKYTEPNWSDEIYTIERVRPSKATTATKYVLEDMPKKSWLREHLQIVLGNDMPPKKYDIKTRSNTKDANAPRRSARNK